MITSAIGILGWLAFLASLPLTVLALLLDSNDLGLVAISGGACALAIVCLALLTKGLLLLLRWQPTTRN